MAARKTFGARIFTLRSLAGLSARELDALSGLTSGHARALEVEPNRFVAAQTLARIASVFGVSLDWLYAGDGPEPSERGVLRAVARARGTRVFS